MHYSWDSLLDDTPARFTSNGFHYYIIMVMSDGVGGWREFDVASPKLASVRDGCWGREKGNWEE